MKGWQPGSSRPGYSGLSGMQTSIQFEIVSGKGYGVRGV